MKLLPSIKRILFGSSSTAKIRGTSEFLKNLQEITQIYATNQPRMGQTAKRLANIAATERYGLHYFTSTKDSDAPSDGFILPDGSVVQANGHLSDVSALYENIGTTDITALQMRTGIITINSSPHRYIFGIFRQPSNEQLHVIRLISEGTGKRIYTNFGESDGYNNYNDFLHSVITKYPPVNPAPNDPEQNK